MELFAGKAWVSRCFRLGGYPTAVLDIELGKTLPTGVQHAMDLSTTAGMGLLDYYTVNIVVFI